LFLKGDDSNRREFENRGLAKFTYKRKGKDAALAYYQAPAECLDESRFLVEWSSQSFKAACDAKNGKPIKKNRKDC
jgi:TfoX/Sxy family transcriptional regulator of competence genes